jgi:sugar phosphate permease
VNIEPASPPRSDTGLRRPQLRRRLNDRNLLVAEGFCSGTATATHNAFFVTLLVQLGISTLALGIYSALNGLLANASGLAGSVIARHVPNRRTLTAVTGGLGRSGFLVIALLLVLRGGDVSLTLLIVIALASVSLIGVGTPILTTIIADTVSARERGSFFATRFVASGIGAAVVAIGVAALLRQLSFPSGFTIAYFLAAAAGGGALVAILSLRHGSYSTPAASGEATGVASFRAVSALMWRYAFATFVLWFGAALVGPVLTPYILNDLGATPAFIGLMTATGAIVGLLAQRFWGRRVDRLGAYSVVSVSMIGVSSLPVLYALTPTYWFALAFEVVSGIAWAGYALGNLNYALEIAPAHERARYSSISSAAAGVGAFAGPLTAAGLLSFLDARTVLFMAGAIRLSAFVAVRFARPGVLETADIAASAGPA